MEIHSFRRLPSTQHYLVEALKKKKLQAPVAVITQEQYAGIGSRDNGWEGEHGNFFASVAIKLINLPKDLPLPSASIYFSYIMKKVLLNYHEDVWLKWPNDFYVGENKVGGTITQKVDDVLVCGIGINLKKNQINYSALQTSVLPEVLLEKYLSILQQYPTWKHIFSKYQVEFEKSRRFSVHTEQGRKSLKGARLCKDGSLYIDGEKVFSAR
ncbi:MAG: biotin--[acetyl-CoA-carboxylase] ligase [Sulfurovum sp.]|nr:biotin--[acetyl-CoA-carboxylase] ligase [Sulfurovum sp.]